MPSPHGHGARGPSAVPAAGTDRATTRRCRRSRCRSGVSSAGRPRARRGADLGPGVTLHRAQARGAQARRQCGLGASRRSTACAMAPRRRCGGTSRAVTPCLDEKGTPPTSVLTTGTPLASASSTELGMLSTRLGLMAMRLLRRRAAIVSRSSAAGELDTLGDAQFVGQPAQRALLGPGAGHHQRGIGAAPARPAQRRAAPWRCRRWARGCAPRSADGDRRPRWPGESAARSTMLGTTSARMPMAAEHLLQKARRHDQARTAHDHPHDARRTRAGTRRPRRPGS